MTLPGSFINHLQTQGYHPRSNKHSNALAAAITDDLIRSCAPIRSAASSGRLVYELNVELRFATSNWNIDLALGEPAGTVEVPPGGIARQTPSTIQVAIEIKGVMTEHRKAVKNRKRDFEAHHQHVHNYNYQAVAGVVLVVNGAPRFQSPLVQNRVTQHKNPDALISHCIQQMRSVAIRTGTKGHGIDAGCALVVEHDNIDPSLTRYRTTPPAPTIGDPYHYDAFIQKVCTEWRSRFAPSFGGAG